MKALRVALADDEPLARARLSRLLKEAGCEVVTELEDGPGVLSWIKSTVQVDALFLDINMPGATGLEVMAELPTHLPVVFVTAYAEHAVRAFEAAAVDYVLKPVSADRLAKSLARLREPLTAGAATTHASASPGRYPAKAGEGHIFLELRRTSHFEVEDEVVWAWCGGTRFRTGWSTLAEVEQLFPSGLLRIQRHLLLRPEAVLGLRPLEGGRASIRIAEGLELEVSRTATPKLKEMLGL